MDSFAIPKKVNRHVIKAINSLSTELNNAVSSGSIINEVKYQMRNLVPVRDADIIIRKSLRNLSFLGIIANVAPNMYNTICVDSKSNQNHQTQIEVHDQQLTQTQSEIVRQPDCQQLRQPDCQQLRQPERQSQRQQQRQFQRQTKKQPLKQSYPQCKRRCQRQSQRQKRRQRQAQSHRKPGSQPARPSPNQPPSSQQQNQTNAFMRYFEPRRPINEKSTEALNPNKRKRSLISVSSSLSGDEIEKTRKRFCTQKTLRRAGNFAHLPHSCKHQKGNARTRNSLKSQRISELSINTGFLSRIQSSLLFEPSTHEIYTSTRPIVESTSMLVRKESETSVSLSQIKEEKCSSINPRSNLLNMSSDSSVNNNLNPLSLNNEPNESVTIDSSESIVYSYAVRWAALEYSIKENEKEDEKKEEKVDEKKREVEEKKEEKVDEKKEEKVDEKKEEKVDEKKEDDKDKC